MFWSDWQADKRALREREWAMADRHQVASHLAATVDAKAVQVATELAATVDAKAMAVASLSEHRSQQIQAALAENTALTGMVGDKADAAYNEANQVNEKIKSLGEHLMKDKT